jgi:hypothetical protein
MRWFDNQTLKVYWTHLENVLDKVGFRNKLKEVRLRLSVSTNTTSDRSRIVVGFMELFHSLRERGVVISVEDQSQENHQFMSVDFV